MKQSIGRFAAASRLVVSLTLAVGLVLLVPSNASAVTFPGGAITIPDGNASPFPSTVNVSGLTGGITLITVSLNNFTHTFSGDVDMLLVAPDGKAFNFWSDLGNTPITGFNFTVADSGTINPAQTFTLVNGSTYKPTNNAIQETFPGATYTNRYSPTGSPANGTATFASVFTGVAPNGIWSLYVIDDGGGDIGSLGSWALNITAGGPTAADSSVSGTITDDQGAPVAGTVINLSGTQTRKTITDVNGHYSFENVETNGFYTVRPSRANYSFSPAERSFSQLGNNTDSAFTATAAGGSVNPLDTPEYFVRQHYLDFLGREPDEAGFNFWSDQILECGSEAACIERRTINVSAAYFLSIEFQQTGGLVDGLYRASYGARPQFAEFMPDTSTIARGVVVGRAGWQQLLAANKQAFLDAWVQRPAFRAAYDLLTNEGYVDTLIAHTGINFTSSERDALVNGLTFGTLSRVGVLERIAEDERFVAAKRNETFVMMEYFGYLRRDPDASGFAFWLNKLNEFNGNFEQAEMVKAFIVSGEYRDRFPR